MTLVLNWSHRFYKRHQTLIESGFSATGLALLVALVLLAVPVYPTNWAPVLVALVWLLALRWPWSAYFLALLAVLYPLYSISLYLTILFVAVAVLGYRPLSHFLGATVLILATPVLAEYHLHWLVPVLAGLWWGATNGLWIAAMAATWGKLIAGMAGFNPDWLLLGGQALKAEGIIQRFVALGPLDTLAQLIDPFVVNATVLLYHLLQIGLWGGVALLLGMMANQKWIYKYHPWSSLLLTSTGVLSLGAGHIVLAAWLSAVGTVVVLNQLVLTALVTLVVSSTVDVGRQFLDLPVSPRRRSPKRQRITRDIGASLNPLGGQAVFASATPEIEPVSVDEAEQSASHAGKSADDNRSQKRRSNRLPPDEDSGLILLELD